MAGEKRPEERMSDEAIEAFVAVVRTSETMAKQLGMSTATVFHAYMKAAQSMQAGELGVAEMMARLGGKKLDGK